jgi:hypothetical protein
MAVIYINKISVDLLENDMTAKEILQIDNYYISEVVNKNYFTERDGQKILKSTNENLKKTMESFFGKEMSVFVGKKKQLVKSILEQDNLQQQNPLKDYGKKLIQHIIQNNNTLLRAYTNAFYWIKNEFTQIENRNLGYYGQRQTEMMSYIKSIIIDWLLDKKNEDDANELIGEYFDNDTISNYITKLATLTVFPNSEFVNFVVLNKIHKIPIIIHVNDDVMYIYDSKLLKNRVYDIKKQKKTETKDEILTKYTENKDAINLQIDTQESGNEGQVEVSVVYYK